MSSWDDCLSALLNEYRDKPDDYVLSIGHWTEPVPTGVAGINLPEFRAFLRIELGDLRKQRGQK